jgi:hypothetical protein
MGFSRKIITNRMAIVYKMCNTYEFSLYILDPASFGDFALASGKVVSQRKLTLNVRGQIAPRLE